MNPNYLKRKNWLIGIMIIYSVMAIFFWESRQSIKGGGMDVGFAEAIFVFYLLRGVFQKAKTTHFLILFFTTLRILVLILAFTNTRNHLVPMENWHLLMFMPLFLIAGISFKIITTDFQNQDKKANDLSSLI